MTRLPFLFHATIRTYQRINRAHDLRGLEMVADNDLRALITGSGVARKGLHTPSLCSPTLSDPVNSHEATLPQVQA